MTRLLILCAALCLGIGTAPQALGADPNPDAGLRLLPRPAQLTVLSGCALDASAVDRGLDALPSDVVGARDLIRERWRGLGEVPAKTALPVVIRRVPGPAQGYVLTLDPGGVHVTAASADGAFYALITLAQLARREGTHWRLPCGRIADAPALPWRILSDDVSRGPLPTMRYFKERIRTIAAFKMNGYSPYMEHVFVDGKHPLPAPLDGITPGELSELARYAHRYHVAFIPEQQTFAHMHETLKVERYAALAETPHGYLLTPANPGGEAYVRDLIGDELAAVPHPPFFHIGSDEPSDLGRGASQTLVEAEGDGPVYVRHVVDTADFVIHHGGGRPLIWDDALARHPEMFSQLPRRLVFVNWHYGNDATYRPYIDRIARGGFDQLVAPGALNWNEIYPDLDGALTNIGRFVTEGKDAHVLGLFQTVWHDDGETLFEATWYPVLYAAASAWEKAPVDRVRYARDFGTAFFGSDDPRYADDFAALATCRTYLRENAREYGDYLFWSDPLDPHLSAPFAMSGGTFTSDAAPLRLAAERVMDHLRLTQPPLHRNAAAVMAFAARRYDTLGRDVEIAHETREYYDGARASAAKKESYALRQLFVTKYLFWEMRDSMLTLAELHRRAWEYENRSSHEESVLERYRIAAERAVARADAISGAVYDDYVAGRPLPEFDEVLSAK